MSGEGKRRRLRTALAALAAAIAVFALVTALALDKPGKAQPTQTAAEPERYAILSLEAPHVRSSYSFYSVERTAGALVPGDPPVRAPLSAANFREPVALYRRWAAAQLLSMHPSIQRLEQALATGDREAAKAAWRSAFSRYLRLGAVYLVGPVAALNEQIDGTAGGLPGGAGSPSFTGLHRIEYGLWTGQPTPSLLGYAQRLDAAVTRLRLLLGRVGISPLEYATRAHEILEDAVRDLLSGTDVPWSGEGVLGTEAGLRATEEVMSTLHLLLQSEDGENEQAVGPAVEAELSALRGVLSSLARAHGGRLPANRELTIRQAALLHGTIGGALEALALVPGSLEAEPRPHITPIPPREERIDP